MIEIAHGKTIVEPGGASRKCGGGKGWSLRFLYGAPITLRISQARQYPDQQPPRAVCARQVASFGFSSVANWLSINSFWGKMGVRCLRRSRIVSASTSRYTNVRGDVLRTTLRILQKDELMKYRPRRSVELAVGVLIIPVGKELPGPQIAGIEDMADQFT